MNQQYGLRFLKGTVGPNQLETNPMDLSEDMMGKEMENHETTTLLRVLRHFKLFFWTYVYEWQCFTSYPRRTFRPLIIFGGLNRYWVFIDNGKGIPCWDYHACE